MTAELNKTVTQGVPSRASPERNEKGMAAVAARRRSWCCASGECEGNMVPDPALARADLIQEVGVLASGRSFWDTHKPAYLRVSANIGEQTEPKHWGGGAAASVTTVTGLRNSPDNARGGLVPHW